MGIAVTGGGDLARVGPLLRDLGKRFEVVCCKGSLSGLLAAQADQVTTLDAAALSMFPR